MGAAKILWSCWEALGNFHKRYQRLGIKMGRSTTEVMKGDEWRNERRE